ncbi:flagellar hook-length control protein FliK [Caldichromatium japonicum]|uniref:Flagellar hook-length control protein FliK n=1 Tax=Caldichromatium japonicum TaxID=2699430 RepID=A0A6G7VDW6_9GAMM|nr:flagellar hook-length control protein FliK [Caldichromatium japonicum]QIK37987.1 flagellar hook-length control protein FliK [Caldichromatium japonicum]
MGGPNLTTELANAVVTHARLSTQALNLTRRLQVGMQVELMPIRARDQGWVEIQVRIPGESKTWTSGIQARIIGAMPDASGARPATPLRAEVVATSPILSLRLIPPPPQTLPTPSQAPLTEGRTWLDQQFRQCWPSAQPLAPTLARLAAQLGLDGLDAEPQAATPSLLNHSGARPTLVTQVQQTLLQLLNQLATAAELTHPERLARAIERSGLWLEARLVQAARDPSQADALRADLKTRLLALAQSLRTAGGRAADMPSVVHPGTGGDEGSVPQQGQPLPLETGADQAVRGDSGARELLAGREGSASSDEGSSTFAKADGLSDQDKPPASSRAADEPVLTDDSQTADQSPPEDMVPADPNRTDERRTEQQRLTQDQTRLDHLEREVEAMIKQVITRQLHALDSQAGQTQWLVELPFRTPSGVLALEADIQRDQLHPDQKDASWTIILRLDLPHLGPLHIRLTWCNAQLNGCLQAADPSGAELIRGHLDELRARLEARDIAIAALYAGQRAFAPPAPPCRMALLNECA